MRINKLLYRDIRLGIIKRSHLFIFALLFALLSCYECHQSIIFLNNAELMDTQGTVLDYCLYALRGMRVYTFNPKSTFEIPLKWFVLQMSISYFVAYYSENDFKKSGRNVFLSCKNRGIWWLSKVITCALSVLVLFFATIFFISLIAIIDGASPLFSITESLITIVNNSNALYLSLSDYIFVAFILPIVATAAICMLQLFLSFVIKPVTSFALMCGLYVLSAYYTSPFLLGNYTMWLRCSYYDECGVSPISGLILSLGLIALILMTGYIYFLDVDVI